MNFVTYGFDSIHFAQNTRSSLAIILLVLVILAFVSFRACLKKVRDFIIAALLVLVKTAVYMVFIVSAIIQLRYNGDDGL